jgi:hypothetical protein
MRLTAILLNAALIIFLSLCAVFEDEEATLLIAALVSLAPISSLVLITTSTSEGDNWISLYFRRKMLEERIRIENLAGKTRTEQKSSR